ncbi:2-amino-4-hydroxy-6-hydroxymethyldihydropteridine diphosphokinase [Motiliproteus sp. SC1-56]|uniref:2-amino-4-hydroxy-6- hydroxymethyldihydropteridine diphosphokinase n=1 Tax=Motiliproteus sp. SC1-56 TaxID=2799565 RepID=UPI001A8DA496|nr:2-amino-4-hydroxy-6-hydroxymethyldihydropteridine diphosphokinase [Motiliproteus sp. SC1-56]
MVTVYLSLGSNIDRCHYITRALDRLADDFGPLQISSVFESEAVGFEGDPFYNLAVGLSTDLPVDALYRRLREIEHDNDRCRQAVKFSSRTLDIDILSYGDYIGAFEGGHLPRAEITYNAFVLWPLAEIAPAEHHPELGRSYADLWADFERGKQKLRPVSFAWRGRELSRLEDSR